MRRDRYVWALATAWLVGASGTSAPVRADAGGPGSIQASPVVAEVPAAPSADDAAPDVAAPDTIAQLDLESLLEVEVTSVSRRAEKRSAAPSAITVITAEDLRRRGVTTIAEALRGIPGVNVAQVDANKWSISARGFTDRFANMLLVMMDGRSLYTPLFGGTYWDIQDTLLDDIDRIEVIRGPGGTLWGANAVNGVINIITKPAGETQGILAATLTGSHERNTTAVRYGGRIGDAFDYRVFGKYLNRAGFPGGIATSGDDDEWNQHRLGFRLDWEPSAQGSLMLQGAWYNGFSGGTGPGPNSAASFEFAGDPDPVPIDAWVAGFHLLGRYTHRFGEGLDLSLQAYVDNTQREDDLWRENRITYDFDFQMRLPSLWRNELTWGLRYRNTSDHFAGRDFDLSLTDPGRRDHLFSGYLQDRIQLLPETLTLTLGTKLEHNSYTGFEYQPSGRFAWTPSDHHTLWGAASRAVRTPTRADRSIRIRRVSPAVPLTQIDPTGDPSIDVVLDLTALGADRQATVLTAYEFGYRYKPIERLEFDWAVFLNRYRRLPDPTVGVSSSVAFGTPILFDIVAAGSDRRDARTYGSELAISYLPFDRWRLDLAYSFIRLSFRDRVEQTDSVQEDQKREAQTDPSHMWTLRSLLDLPYGLELDTHFSVVGNRGRGAASYGRLDFRLGWRPTENLELSFSALNVLEHRHEEFGFVDLTFPTEVPRSFFAKLTGRF